MTLSLSLSLDSPIVFLSLSLPPSVQVGGQEQATFGVVDILGGKKSEGARRMKG